MAKMFEQLKEEVATLHKSTVFKTFKKKSPNSYLCAGFLIIEHLEKIPWQSIITVQKNKRLQHLL